MKTTLVICTLMSSLAFHPAFAEDLKTPAVVLSVPKDSSYASLAKVLDACGAAGLDNVSLETTQANGSLQVQVSPDMSYASLAKVLDACRAAGLQNIRLGTMPTNEAPRVEQRLRESDLLLVIRQYELIKMRAFETRLEIDLMGRDEEMTAEVKMQAERLRKRYEILEYHARQLRETACQMGGADAVPKEK